MTAQGLSGSGSGELPGDFDGPLVAIRFPSLERGRHPLHLGDTLGSLFVQASWDRKAQTLTFDLFGARPARTVSIGKPVVGNFRPAAQPSYSPDPRVRAGEQRLLDVPVQGMTSTMVRTIRLPGGKVKTDTLKSVYKPWGAVYGVAPGDGRLK